MRVVLVITKGELGGAQTHVAELCSALRDRCEFLVLIGGCERSPLRDALTALNIRVESLPELSNRLSPRSLLVSLLQVRRYAQSWGADLIHVHSALAGVVGRVAARLAGIPVVYTVHGFGFKPQVPFVRRACAYIGERLLAPFSTHFICVSSTEREFALRLGIPPSRISVIANGLSDSPLRAAPSSSPATLIMVARMAAPKRHDLLLKALQVLRARGIAPPPTVMAGAGPLMTQVGEAASAFDLSCITMSGDVPDIAARLSQAQIFVLLSDHEGHPISVIEAMRAGLPIVASDLPGIRGQVTDGVEGLLTGGEPAQVANAIERLIADPELRDRMGAAARCRYEKEFSAFGMAEQVEDVYLGTAGKTRSLSFVA